MDWAFQSLLFASFIGRRFAFVWAAWLVAGPDEASMRFFFSKVRSLTTDFGIEVPGIPKARVISPTFLPHFRSGTRLKAQIGCAFVFVALAGAYT